MLQSTHLINTMQKYSRIFHFIAPFILFLVFSAILFIGVRKNTQSFRFEDETDHVAMGWMMHRFDKQLYRDLSTNHQPFPVLIGAAFSKVISFSTLFELVERLRISMFLYAFLWGTLIVFRFRWRGLFAHSLTYSLGYYFFAWHVLAESLAAAPLLFASLYLCEKLFIKQKSPLWREKFDGVLLAISGTLMVTSLLPLWPFCLFAGLAILWLSSQTTRKYTIIVGLLTLGLILSFFSPVDWFRETVYNNLYYFLPELPPLTLAEKISLLFYPFLSFLKPLDKLSPVLMFPLLLTIGVLILRQWKRGKPSSKVILFVSFLYFLLILSNPRVMRFPIAFYEGFHLEPFIALFFALIVSACWFTIQKLFDKKGLMVLGITLTAFFLLNMNWATRKNDKLNEYYIQYGTIESYSRLISAFKTEGDTLLSGPNGVGYMNMRTDLPIAGRQLFHLPWSYNSPELRKEYQDLLKDNPPTFIYFLDNVSGYHSDLQPVLKANYTEMVQGKRRTFLFFSNTKKDQMTDAQKKYLEENDFHFRTDQEVELY